MNDLFKNTNMVINQNAKNAKKSADPEPVLTAVGAQTEAAFWAVQCSAVQYSDVCQTGRLAKNVFIFSIYFCLAACTAKENVTGPFHLKTETGYYKKQYNNIYLFQIAPNLDLESTITNMRGEDGDQEAMYHTMDTIEGICTLTAPDHLQEDEIDSTGTKFDSNYLTTDLYYKSGLYQVLSMFPYGNFQFKKLNFLYISHVTHGEIPAELTRSEGKTTNCDNAVADLATPLSLTLETTAGKELKVVGTAFEIPQSDRIENASGGISKQLSQTSAIFNLHCSTVPLSHFTTVLLSYFTTCSVYYDRPVVNYDISTNMDQFRGLGFRKEPGELGSAFTFLRPDCNHAVVNLVTNPSLGITANKKLEVVVGVVGKEEPSLAASGLQNTRTAKASYAITKQEKLLSSITPFLLPSSEAENPTLVSKLAPLVRVIVYQDVSELRKLGFTCYSKFVNMFTLLSYSCSRLSNQHRLATMYARPLYELPGQNTQDPTTILPSSYMVILYMLETLKGLSVYQATQETVQEKIDSLVFSSLWFSGLGSAVSLILAQYTAVKMQHEHDLTLGQRIIYFVSCIFITIAMMTSSLIFITVIILPVFTYIGRYHIMILVILFAAILGLGTLISLTLEFFGMNPTTITTDRVVPRFETNNLLTNFLRFSQVGSGQWASLLYAATRVAPGFSMVHGELHISFHLKSKLVITNPSPGVTAIKKPKVLEVARKDEKSGLTTSCLQTTRPMYSIIFTKAESTPKHHYHDIPLASQAYCLPHLHTWVRTCAPVVTMKRCPAQLSTISSPG